MKTQDMVIMAAMIALKMILSQFSIYATPFLMIFSLAYLPGAMVSILYGPYLGILFGFAADTAGYFANPVGPYFVGFVISEMVEGLIYGLLLYKKPLTVWRVAVSRILIMITVTFGLNYIWLYLLYGEAFSKYYSWVRISNNLIQMPVSVLLILFVGKLVLRLHGEYHNQIESTKW